MLVYEFKFVTAKLDCFGYLFFCQNKVIQPLMRDLFGHSSGVYTGNSNCSLIVSVLNFSINFAFTETLHAS